MFKEQERYTFKTWVYDRHKKIDESIKFKEQEKVYIFGAQWLDSLSVSEKGIYFISGPTAQLLISRDFRATKPPQRIYLENLPRIM